MGFCGGVRFALFFGVGIAATGDSHHALIAEVTDERLVASWWQWCGHSPLSVPLLPAIYIKVLVSEQFVFAEMQSLYRTNSRGRHVCHASVLRY
jgi:hypothetical protein